ncbi:hypothetical protein [Leuconostoc holzapfelii]|uniref:Uncharacterized protein n=1 Tax=Leuconostoc holzapfelii TaxID=434464 RepID=A0A846ZGZ0_9LACO|nr:hypothetical protein [Leuconostoc holzapfelii]NKZ19129.1 hypothetical protein [Leuconostoc holzapfelii]
MKIRYIALSILGTATIVAGGLVYWGSQNQKPIQAETAKQSPSTIKKKSDTNVLVASGVDYKIIQPNGLGGVIAPPIPINKIMSKKVALDVVASTPNFNHSKLVHINPDGDNWIIEVNNKGINYTVTLNHYQDKYGTIVVKDLTSYGFTIPEKYYAPYREKQESINTAFSASLAAGNNGSTNNSDSDEYYVNAYGHTIKKGETDNTGIAQRDREAHAAEQSASNHTVDDGYDYVLNFSDGTQRLTNTAPTGPYWQKGTTSAPGSNQTGRTNFNQIKPSDPSQMESFNNDNQQKIDNSKLYTNSN